ncbi:GntR family transcriptional regulator [Streptomyces sp. NBC_01116]|uniref:GntR family transcriptional regulator n=1 Tax=Streptomyces sp. NBC_01116 TaxID=2903752 RepID=UPI00352DFF76
MTESQERAGSDDRRTGGDATVGTGPGAGAVRAAPAGTGDDGAAPSGTSADVRAAPVPPAPAFAPDSLVLNRKLPLWYQVSQSLRASILGRPRDASARLPTEEQLAAHYGVSVLTMRQALKELEAEGLISRHRRRGTFIEPRARRVSPVRLLGSVDAIVAQQSGEATTVLGHGPTAVPGDLAEFFPGCAEVTCYRRLRRDGQSDEPTNWAENAVLPDIAARIDVADLERWPMTKVLRDVVGVRISRITDTVEARLADPVTAELLQVPLLSPILHYTGVTYDEDGRVVDVARIRYRGDRFSFSVTVEAH